MNSFDEFSYNLNQKPKNTRSSLIASHHQTRKAKDSHLEEPRTYNSSGRPFNLSDFKNDMTSGYFSNDTNASSMGYGPSDSWLPQDDRSSRFPGTLRQEQIERPNYSFPTPFFYQENDVYQKNAFVPYNDSGRTFNLTEFQANNSKNLKNFQPSLHTNGSNSKRNRTHNADSSRLTFHHVPCDFLKTHCHEFFQNSQCQQNVVPRKLRELKNNEMQPKTLLQRPRNQLFEILVKDYYNPGIIVDSVNGLVDFNKHAFDAVFDCGYIPLDIDEKSIPMSLLEAFSLRIQYEQDLRDDLEKRELFCSYENNVTTANENISYRTHRDELKLASTIDIDLMTKVGNFPETPLTEAINCLLKAEKMNSFDRNVHLAEEAIRSASDGQQELAALKSTCSFKFDIRKNETKTMNTFEPLAIISYIGTTKPNNE